MTNSRKENYPSYLKEDSRLSIVADMRAADVLLKFYRNRCGVLERQVRDLKLEIKAIREHQE